MSYLVLGGTGQIGSAIVKGLLSLGEKVYFTFRTNINEAKGLESLGAIGIQIDLRERGSLSKLISIVSDLRGVTVASSIDFSKLLSDERPGLFKEVHEFDSDFISECFSMLIELPFEVIRNFAKVMKKSGGNIVFLNSLDGLKSTETPVFFSQSKSSLKGLVESASRELGPDQIKVNQVCIGLLEGRTANLIHPKLREKYRKHCALNRFGKTDEVASFVIWMLLNNTYISGQSILLDGAL